MVCFVLLLIVPHCLTRDKFIPLDVEHGALIKLKQKFIPHSDIYETVTVIKPTLYSIYVVPPESQDILGPDYNKIFHTITQLGHLPSLCDQFANPRCNHLINPYENMMIHNQSSLD